MMSFEFPVTDLLRCPCWTPHSGGLCPSVLPITVSFAIIAYTPLDMLKYLYVFQSSSFKVQCNWNMPAVFYLTLSCSRFTLNGCVSWLSKMSSLCAESLTYDSSCTEAGL